MPRASARRVKVQVGLRIVQLRQDRGLTQERLAELVGMSVRQMKRFEAGVSALNVDQLERIAEVLGVATADLLKPPDRTIHRAPGRRRKSPKAH